MRFCKRSRFESWGSCCHSSWFSAKWSSQWNMWSEAAEICTKGPLIWGNGAARGNRGCICTRRNPVQWASYNLNFSQEESAHADSMAKLGQWNCKGKPWLHLDSKKVWLSGNLWASYNLKCSQQESAHADSAAIRNPVKLICSGLWICSIGWIEIIFVPALLTS